MVPLISVIVPIYKVEEYLDACVQSLVTQTYKNIEIILIDDGSPDNCPVMCDNYAKDDKRIKVIHKKNGGLSDARNEGLKKATGKYILFVDSDDYIDFDTCERFLDIIGYKTPDIVVGNAQKIENKKVSILKHHFNTHGQMVTGKLYIKKELKHETMYMASCFNLYNRSFLLGNKLNFKNNFLHEDEHFTPRAFLKAKAVIGTNIVFYNHRIRENSITTTQNKIKNAKDMIQICKELEKIYSQIDDKELQTLLMDNLVSKYLYTFQVAKLYKKQYAYLVDKDFLRNKACRKKNKIKVALFTLDKKLYYYTNKASKYLKQILKHK